MKKVISLLLAFLLLFSLAACGGQEAEPASSAVSTPDASPAQAPAPAPAEAAADPSRAAAPQPAAAAFAGGSGTEGDPYQIETAEQLAYLSLLLNDSSDWNSFSHYLTAYYVLTADIALNDTTDFASWSTKAPAYQWSPIGTTIHGFQGHFDGQGHTISGLYLYDAEEAASGRSGGNGLFYYTKGAEIRNLTIAESYIVLAGSSFGGRVGSLVGCMEGGRLVSCESRAVIDYARHEECGGLVGQIFGLPASGSAILESCTFSGTVRVSGYAHVGGLVGSVSGNLQMESCVNSGTLLDYGGADYRSSIGGLLGEFYPGDDSWLEGCENRAELVFSEGRLGGLIGYVFIDPDNNDGVVTIDRLQLSGCSNSGRVSAASGEEATGGLIGYVYNNLLERNSQSAVCTLALRNCENSGAIHGPALTGGLVGDLNMAGQWTVVGCSNSGRVDSDTRAGGILGAARSSYIGAELQNCSNSGEIYSLGGRAGGIVCTVTGISLNSVTSDTPLAPLSISLCRNSGAISGGDSTGGLGGIVGHLEGTSSLTRIEGCLNEGSILGGGSCRVGGILGDSEMGGLGTDDTLLLEIEGCVNRGALGERAATVPFTDELRRGEDAPETNDAGNESMFLLGGSCVGGICGYFTKGSIRNCVNTGEILLDPDTVPIFTRGQLQFFANNTDTEGHPVFCGGICGIFYSSPDSPAELSDCAYALPIPIPCYGATGADGIQDVSALDAEEASARADALLR